jgi:hypothetical protein
MFSLFPNLGLCRERLEGFEKQTGSIGKTNLPGIMTAE